MDTAQKIGSVATLVAANMPYLPYHNLTHALDVYAASQMYATLEHVAYHERVLLGTAALLHDVVSIPHAKDNEERSVELARVHLPRFSYTPQEIETVSRIVMATKILTKPADLLEEIICDADLDNLGRDDFLEKNRTLAEELGIGTDEGWYLRTKEFLKEHRYYTASARSARAAGKEENCALVRDILLYAYHLP